MSDPSGDEEKKGDGGSNRTPTRTDKRKERKQEEDNSSKRAKPTPSSAPPSAADSNPSQIQSAASAPPATIRTPSGAERCFSDGVLLIFSHLSLKEMMPAARSCRYWYEVAKQEKSRGVKFHDASAQPAPSSRLSSLLSSPLRHHVTDLWIDQLLPHNFNLSQLPHLTALRVGLQLDEPPAALPPVLSPLHRLVDLTLCLPPDTWISFNMSLFQQLQFLRRLTLHSVGDFTPSAVQLAALSRLPLASLDRQVKGRQSQPQWTLAEMGQLLPQPPQLKLEAVERLVPPGLAESIQEWLLLVAPLSGSLQVLVLDSMQPWPYPQNLGLLLEPFSHLRRLQLESEASDQLFPPSLLLSALVSMHELVQLTLSSIDWSHDSLQSLAQGCPKLEELGLIYSRVQGFPAMGNLRQLTVCWPVVQSFDRALWQQLSSCNKLTSLMIVTKTRSRGALAQWQVLTAALNLPRDARMLPQLDSIYLSAAHSEHKVVYPPYVPVVR